jgi:hypothetical protein
MSDKLKMGISVVLLFTLVMFGVNFFHNKHMEKVEARPNYTINQSIESIDGKMELTTSMYFHPLAKKDAMFNIGTRIYTNTVEVTSSDLERIKLDEYSKAEPFESDHRALNKITE